MVMVQHATFCINSLCHMIGKRPYSTNHSARDSWIAAIFTMGEGYHNYHHEFQWDYRNGVKPCNWIHQNGLFGHFQKIGLTSGLKRVPSERILLAETKETKRQVNDQISIFKESLSTSASELMEQSLSSLEKLQDRLNEISGELQSAVQEKINLSKTKLNELSNEVRAMISEIESFAKLGMASA